jgi:hypothetical protein
LNIKITFDHNMNSVPDPSTMSILSHMTDEALSGAFGTVILKLARQKIHLFC